jgi:cellulose synthase/poly-beta-1,6-N-acetylglucosamine synthase-like glycosyltransferase
VFDQEAIGALVADFADPEVGAVSGELVITTPGERSTPAAQEGGLYWRYEKWIRASESLIDSSIGMTGAIAALRRQLFEPLPTDTVLDDVLIPLRIIRRGYRVAFEPRARAYDGVPATARDEFARKVRTLAGNFQLFARERWMLRPSANRLWIETLSHKGLRLALPLFFATAALSNAALLDQPFFQATFLLQTMFYAAGICGGLWPGLRRKTRLISLPFTICFLTWATVVAFMRFARQRQAATWERAAVNEPA